MSTLPEHDPDYDEYTRLFHDLIMGLAEETRRDHAELVEHGFRLVEVIGSAALLYERDGKTYTKDYALAAVRAIKEQKGSG